jgi:hypothetical protein
MLLPHQIFLIAGTGQFDVKSVRRWATGQTESMRRSTLVGIERTARMLGIEKIATPKVARRRGVR